MISKEQLEEFKSIYKKEFGEEISDEEALKKGTKIVNLMKTIYMYKSKNKESCMDNKNG